MPVPIHDLPEFDLMTGADVGAIKAARKAGLPDSVEEGIRKAVAERAVSPEESEALDMVDEALEKLEVAAKVLGVTEEEEARWVDPFAGIEHLENLDGVRPGIPAIDPDLIARKRKALREAKTQRERMAEVVTMLAAVGAGLAKGAAS